MKIRVPYLLIFFLGTEEGLMAEMSQKLIYLYKNRFWFTKHVKKSKDQFQNVNFLAFVDVIWNRRITVNIRKLYKGFPVVG